MDRTLATEHRIGKLVARAWLDSDFCQRLMDSPDSILKEAGIAASDLIAFVARNQGKNISEADISLPAKPGDLVDAPLIDYIDNLLAFGFCRASTS